MKINDLMLNPGADAYYDKSFRDTLEAHMHLLRNSAKTQSYEVDSHKATVYQGDLFGYLLAAGIAAQYHWVIMRVNQFYSPHEFGPQTLFLHIPDTAEVERMRLAQKSSGYIQV